MNKLAQKFDAFINKAKNEPYVAIDIGLNNISIVEITPGEGKRKLANAVVIPTPENVFNNHEISKTDDVGKAIRAALDARGITCTKAVTCAPSPSAFAKKVKISAQTLKQLKANIEFEAGNYIPHKTTDVFMDFQVTGVDDKKKLDVTLVAVKNEIVNSYVEALSKAGLETAIMDVDYYALENTFKNSNAENKEKTVALLNIGARYASISILEKGESLVTGEIAVGGKQYTDAIAKALEVDARKAELAKTASGAGTEGVDMKKLSETMDQVTQKVVGELHRQLGFFWNASGSKIPIEAIYLTGGAALSPNLAKELGNKTGVSCLVIDPFNNLDFEEKFSKDELGKMAPFMSVAVGLGLRRIGDKRHAINK
jgi:type IV pilus assembly protein PilM